MVLPCPTSVTAGKKEATCSIVFPQKDLGKKRERKRLTELNSALRAINHVSQCDDGMLPQSMAVVIKLWAAHREVAVALGTFLLKIRC